MRRLIVMALVIGSAISAVMIGKVWADGHSGYSPEGLPFHMVTHEAVVGEAPTAECAIAQVFIDGAGTATQMGAVTVYRTHCFSPFQDPPIYDGYWEARAANGDAVWGTYTGSLVPTEFDGGYPTRGIITAPYTIEGGTGRFAGAAGQGVSTSDYDLVADEGDFDSVGTISR